jgi:hypothetical protein
MYTDPQISRKAVTDLVTLIISFSLGTNLALILMDGGIVLRVVRFILVVVLCVFMLKQANWARYILVFMYAISSFTMLISSIPVGFGKSLFWGFWFIAMTSAYLYITYRLALSPKVAEYFK